MATYTPTAEMAANAARGLKIRETKPPSQQGGTIIGLGRARDIVARRPMSEDTVRRVKAYFDRHEIDKQGSTWSEEGKGYQSWLLWGGDAGYTWSKNIVDKLNKLEDRYYNDVNDDTAYRRYLYRRG